MELILAIAAFCVIVIAIVLLRRRRKDNMYITRDRHIQAFPPGYRRKGRE